MIFEPKSLKFVRWLVCIISLLCTEISYSQNNYNFDTFSNDFKKILKQPSEWNHHDLLTLMGTAGLTYVTMFTDEQIREIVIHNNQYQNSIAVEFGRIWGEPLSSVMISSSIYLHGLGTGNDANRKLGFEIGESAFYATIITLLFKYSLGRERPRENTDPFSFSPFSFKDDNFLSMNSGHTALAFSLSTVLAKNTSNDYLKIAFFVPAVLTAFSRVYQNHHWTSDVILGGIIGYSVAEFVTGLHQKKSSKNDKFSGPQEPIKLLNLVIPL